MAPGTALEVPGVDKTVNMNVRDIYEAYGMFGEMICGTHMVHMGSPEREEACSFASSRYVLYLESTIVVLHIDRLSRDTIHLYGYMRPSQ
jgi:DNA invertase Pin-like site-specific DNA recombinase